MRTLFTLIAATMLCLTTFAQIETFEYNEVVEVENATADELFNRASEWFARTYGSSTDVIKLKDLEQRKIIGKGAFKSYVKVLGSYTSFGYVHYTISIATKEGKYLYVIDNVYHDGSPHSAASGGALSKEAQNNINFTKKYWLTIKDLARKDIAALIKDLKYSMNMAENNDW